MIRRARAMREARSASRRREAALDAWRERLACGQMDASGVFEEAVREFRESGYYFSRADVCRLLEMGVPVDHRRLPYGPGSFPAIADVR